MFWANSGLAGAAMVVVSCPSQVLSAALLCQEQPLYSLGAVLGSLLG